jgi:uncharacterized protein (DUF58 family)
VRSRLPAPSSLSRPGLVLGAVAVALYVIARSTGAGWDIVVLCALVAIMLIAAVWPGIALTGVRATAHAPRDGTVGRVLPIEVTLKGRARGLRVRVAIDASGAGEWTRADAPCTGEAALVPARRGVFPAVVVQVSSSSPLGLVAWRRWVRVDLDRPIEVAPRTLPVRYEPTRGADREAQSRPRASATGHEVTRGVREYVDGDAIRLVHWPATARAGAVMVRELEGPQRPRLVIVVDLRGPDIDVENAASRASGLAISALASGTMVDLATVEADGPRTAPVQSPVEIGRRLARAIPGPPPSGAVPPGVEIRHVRPGRLE